jgi:hypothetical protein
MPRISRTTWPESKPPNWSSPAFRKTTTCHSEGQFLPEESALALMEANNFVSSSDDWGAVAVAQVTPP